MSAGILAIDQGTSSTKALLLDGRGRVAARAARRIETRYPQAGWAEQDGETIWRSVVEVVAELVATGHAVAGVAISNQRETVGLWGVDGRPVAPFVLWQCRRTSEHCARLRGVEPEIHARTGLAVDPMFSATKLAWLLDHTPGARDLAGKGGLRAGTVDAWLLWNLTGGLVHATDHSNASRTQLMNLETLGWDPELAAIFDVPRQILPDIQPSGSLFGVTADGATALPAGVPICAMMGDSHAALFGHGFDGPGRIKATCGTGSSLMTVTDRRIRSGHGLSEAIAWSRADGVLHALEGNIVVSGHIMTFIARLLNLQDEQALIDLAFSVPDSGGVVVVPALAGLGAPHWRDEARGLVSGMTLGTQPAHVARAALEAVALQIRDVFVAMEADLGQTLPSLSVDGGAVANDALAQLLADVLERPVHRPASQDISALGAARMGALQLGLPEPIASASGEATVFLPAMGAAARGRLLLNWSDAVARTVMARSNI